MPTQITEILSYLPNVFKVMTLVLLGMYIVFAIIFLRQEQLMDRVIDETFETVLRVLLIVHLVAAIGVFILAFLVL